jgi:hypothetical protein
MPLRLAIERALRARGERAITALLRDVDDPVQPSDAPRVELKLGLCVRRVRRAAPQRGNLATMLDGSLVPLLEPALVVSACMAARFAIVRLPLANAFVNLVVAAFGVSTTIVIAIIVVIVSIGPRWRGQSERREDGGDGPGR